MQKTQEEFKANILSALAHPNRIRIIELLKNGTKCNCEIGPELELEQSNLSRHMKILVQEGIVVSWKDGLRVNYKVSDKRIFAILDLAGNVAHMEAKVGVEVLEEA
ncbi:MAG: metalloregulator ArsR/SmtB family transcription factor [Bacteroidota bacterium]|nr:metalloregulator ArsR/SmtB family transcription factor [Bacteroidota bacterium]